MPVPLLIGAVVIAAAGTAMSMASASAQAKAAGQAAKANSTMQQQEQERQAQLAAREAQVAQNQALQEQQLHAVEQDSQRREAERLFGQQRAVIASSGVEFSGSPLLTAIETAQEAELQIHLGQWESQQRQQALRDQASLRQFEAGEFRRAGRNTLAMGAFGAQQARMAGTYGMIGAGLQGASQIAGIGTNYLLTQRGYGLGTPRGG